MNTQNIKISFLACLFLVFGTVLPVQAQFSNIGDLVSAGQEDLETLTKAYLTPIPSGIGSTINSGWTMEAGPHSTLGFDIQFRGALAFIPDGDQNFDLNDLTLNNIRPQDPNDTVSPTIGGSDSDGPVVVLEDNDGNAVEDFTLPGGTGLSIIPSPMVQASVGIIKDTDITVRYIPTVSQDEISFGLRGAGIKHGINQWIPGGNLFPVDISIMAGFTNLDITGELDVQPKSSATPNDPEDANADFDNQEAQISINNFTVKALVGKSLPVISVYGGVGYETSTTTADLVGNYPVTVRDQLVEQYEVITNPVSYSQDGSNSFSLLAGAKAQFLFFNIFAEYTLADYSTVNAGIAFSFR